MDFQIPFFPCAGTTLELNQEISCQLNIKFENVADLIPCSTLFYAMLSTEKYQSIYITGKVKKKIENLRKHRKIYSFRFAPIFVDLMFLLKSMKFVQVICSSIGITKSEGTNAFAHFC